MTTDERWKKIAQLMEREARRPFGVYDGALEPQSLIGAIVSWIVTLCVFAVVIGLTRAFLGVN